MQQEECLRQDLVRQELRLLLVWQQGNILWLSLIPIWTAHIS